MRKIVNNSGKILVSVGLALALIVVSFPQPEPVVAENTGANCTSGQFTAEQFQNAYNDGKVTVSLTVDVQNKKAKAQVSNETGCEGPIALSSYKMYDRKLSTQQIFAKKNSILPAGPASNKTLEVALPDCMAQIDFWYGSAPDRLRDDVLYSNPIDDQPLVISWKFYLNTGVGYMDAAGQFCTNTTPPPPAPPMLICTPANQTVAINQNATVNATGGTGTYAWTATGGNPSTGTGSTFTTKYSTSGDKTVTVVSGPQTKHCVVKVSQPTPPPPVTPPPPAIVGCRLILTKTVSSTSAKPDDELSYVITVKNTGDKNCTGGGVKLVDVVDNLLDYQRQTRTSNITAGYGDMPAYHQSSRTLYWNADVLTPGEQASVTWYGKVKSVAQCSTKEIPNTAKVTADQLDNMKTWVSSNTVKTTVQTSCPPPPVTPPPPPALVCAPSTQTVNVNQNLSTVASGGTGTYSWTATGGTPSTGTGSTFTTKYTASGSKTITVSSGSQNASCNVIVNQPTPPPPVTPPPAPQNPKVKIEKHVRNVTRNGSFTESVTALRGEVVEFRVKIWNDGNATASNLHLTDVLSNDTMLNNFGSLSISANSTGNLIHGGSFFDSLPAGQAITVTYRNNIKNDAPAGGVCNTATVKSTNAGQAQDVSCVTVTVVAGGNVSLSFAKSAWNNTKNKDATTVTASREDFITYTLAASNSGNSDATGFVITDDLSGVLPLADMIDTGGGTLSGNTLTYPAMTIPAGNTVIKQFRVRVKHGLASNISYVMKNTYGNEVKITINNPQTYTAPKAGSNTGSLAAIGFAGLLTAGFALHQKKNLFKAIFS